MTTARSLILPPGEPGAFHCVSRCVRRSWLCGVDPYSGRDYQHRRQWIEDRLFELAEIFAVGIHSYAVMSNHVHLVIRIDPALTATWSAREVAERGVALHCPARFSDEKRQSRIAAWTDDEDQLVWLRTKLGSLSHFMQALNQPIAQAANLEDGCTGKFWEGRYKCQRLEDDSAVLSAMAYVDLNPVRANMADDLPTSDYTSAQRRIQRIENNKRVAGFGLKPVTGLCTQQLLDITESSYLQLVDWTGRLLHPGKTGLIAGGTPSVLRAMDISERRWEGQVRGTETIYWRAIGSADSLCRRAEELGQLWLRGIRAVMALEPPG